MLLEAAHIKNKINHLEKIKLKLIVIEKIQKKKKKIVKNNKLIIETQERFKSEGYNAFTE